MDKLLEINHLNIEGLEKEEEEEEEEEEEMGSKRFLTSRDRKEQIERPEENN